MKQRILFLGNSYLVIYKFRKELVEHFVKEGYEVYVSFPNGPFGDGKETSEKMGCKFIEANIERRGKNPFSDLKLLYHYVKLIRNVSPNYVFAFTVKCDVYGGLACRITGTKLVANITGLGKGLVSGWLTRTITSLLYKSALKNATVVFFQNEGDKKFFLERKLYDGYNICLPGSGVNLTQYRVLPYPDANKIVFTYVARVMKAKGIEQFLGAAEFLKNKYNHIEFHICGFCEEDYKQVLEEMVAKGTIVYHGLVDNIIKYIELSHCIVLPSFHPEGISNVLLEGAACGRPLITTDRIGCRETMVDGETGFLIKERDTNDLIEKMERFIAMTNDDRMQMGLKGRLWIEKTFDRNIVVNAYDSVVKSN